MTEKINIYHAISEILNNGKLPKEVKTITGFDPKLLVQIKSKSVYNHNYYKYDGIAVLLELADDDSMLEYLVCDNDFNIIGELGSRYDDFTSNVCELEAGWF